MSKSIIRTFIAGALLLCLLFTATIPASATKTSNDTIVFSHTAQRRVYAASAKGADESISGLLTQELKDQLRTAVLQTQEQLDVSSYNLPYAQEFIDLVCNFLFDDVPEAFHLTRVGYLYYPSSGRIASFSFSYSCSPEEYAKQFNECRQAADKLLNGITSNSNLTDVEKALLIHDRLALHCEYGDIYADDSETATLYAALVGRKPVCQGYALAYMYLLEQAGIQSELVSSEALNHAWNIVYIDNKPYHVDVTWDDPTDDIYGRVLHNNFLLSTNALKAGIGTSKAHNADDYTDTPVDTTYDKYYWQNSQAAFQLLNGEIYYIDNIAQEIRRSADKSKVCSVAGTWNLSSDGYYLVGNFAKLISVNGTLYCNMPTAVYSVDTKTGAMKQFIKPALTINGEQFYSIRGFVYENGFLYFDFCNRKNGNSNTAKTVVSASFPACLHNETEIRNAVSATCMTEGYTGDRYCTACGKQISTGNSVSATGIHLWNDGIITTLPSDTAAGEKTFTCTICSAQKTESIPPIEADKLLYGDIDGDGTITAGDARSVLRAAVGLDSLPEEQQKAADVDGDGKLTSSDARFILRYSVGLDTDFPVTKQ